MYMTLCEETNKRNTNLYFIPNVSIRYAITKAALEQINKDDQGHIKKAVTCNGNFVNDHTITVKLDVKSNLTFLIFLHYHEPGPFLQEQDKR